MNHRTCQVTAPANIALVKYMGKSDPGMNLAANPSLSMTLADLYTLVEGSTIRGGGIEIEDRLPTGESELISPLLSEQARQRMVDHLESIVKDEACLPSLFKKYELGSLRPMGLKLCSANSFPASAGIASSASSFAAFTTATAWLMAEEAVKFKDLLLSDEAFRVDLSRLARLGSGSSCRSFLGPWVAWDEQGISSIPVDGAMGTGWSDLVMVVSSKPKEVSSSAAHARVLSSPLWTNRPGRARDRFYRACSALLEGDRRALAWTAWIEFWEMHSLFHTSEEPFTYWLPETLAALHYLQPLLRMPTPPIVTMDAGPNLHILAPSSEISGLRERIIEEFPGSEFLVSGQGKGVIPLFYE